MIKLTKRAAHIFLVIGAVCIAASSHAATKTFPAGSYIIPQDLCWQPTKYKTSASQTGTFPDTVEICNNGMDDDGDGRTDEKNDVASAGHTASPYNCYDLTGCDTNMNDQAVFQSIGLVYELLNAGYPIYWIIDPSKADRLGVDLSLTKSGSDPAVTILHSPKTDSGTLSTVKYIGGPFVVDANDYDTGMQALFDKYKAAVGTNGVKIHKANYDFSAEVDKVLSGKPPDVAVLADNKNSAILTDYLFASGLGNQQAIVFKYLTYQDILLGKLSDYQLLWAPHWIISEEVPSADQSDVLKKIRSFLEVGNAGFFECASLESLERSVAGTTSTPSSYIDGQGILLNKDYSNLTLYPDSTTNKGRIQANGGTQDYQKMKFEKPAHVLTQCGGWRYDYTGGHVWSFRPNEEPDPNFDYNSTVDRFVHDDESLGSDPLGLGYTGQGYDYFTGGRINGNATQGYVAYLAGHKYVKCTNATTSSPSSRYFEFDFTADPALLPTTTIYVEAVYSGCTAGSTCPKASFNLGTQSGSNNTDQTLFVDLDSAEYVPVYDTIDPSIITKYTLRNVTIGNTNTTLDKTLTQINVIFDGNSSATLLTEMRDVTLTSTVVCDPNSPTPASCPAIDSKIYDLNFDTDVMNSLITFEVKSGSCTQGSNCPSGTYDTGTGGKTNGSAATVSVDMSAATYDAANKKLKGVVVANKSASLKTLDQFYVTFTGYPTAKLLSIDDVTTTRTTACTSNTVSTAACPPNTLQSVDNIYQIRFDNNLSNFANGSTISVEAVFSGCTAGSTCPKAQVNKNGSGGTASTYNNITVDMTGANPSTSYLQNIKIRNAGTTDVTITSINISWTDASKKLRKLERTNPSSSTLFCAGGGSCNTTSRYMTSQAAIGVTEALNLVAVAPATLNINLAAYTSLNITLAKALTQCDVDWKNANPCGMKYVLNTLIGLQFQIIPHEYVKAGAIQQDNILYKGSFEYPGYKGHLYAIDVKSNPARQLWDAGKKTIMPSAGSGNPASPANNNANRYIFTNLPGTTTKVNFDVAHSGTTQADTTSLWHYLDPDGTKSLNAVKALINSVRGRKDASETNASGIGEVSKRLGGIEHSAPAIMTKSVLAGAPKRDRVVFVGADDGMLHAFYAGTWNDATNAYSAGTGKEIWAYIPSRLLSSLQNETFTDCNPGEAVTDCTPGPGVSCVCPTFSVAVTVDGSPALGDFFVDHDNNPATQKQWRTILVATAKIMTPGEAAQSVNQGIIFALDVTDPYAPTVLWERTYDSAINTAAEPGSKILRNYYPSASFTSTYRTGENTSFDPNMGDAKGVAIGRVQVGTTLDTYVFATSRWVRQVETSSDPLASHPVWGLSVFAFDFYSGDIRWETKIAYTGDAEGVNESPATPALLDIGENGTFDYVVFGDMQGRLWVLKSIDGTVIAPSAVPAFDVGAGAKEPIGTSVSISGSTIVFGTGGRDSLQDERTYKYHVYAISINSKGEVNVLWAPPFELGAGEKVWSTPVVDGNGTIYLGTAIGYTDIGRPDQVTGSSGRFLALDLGTGKLKKDSNGNDMALKLSGAVIGDIAVESNHVTLQLFDGSTIQVGENDEASFTTDGGGRNPVRVLWWRKL